MFFFQHQTGDLIFKPRSVEHAYFSILNDDLKSAEAVFCSLDSPRAKWGISFVQILEGFLQNFPTYFGIRNFLEIDLDFLIKNEKISYIEQVLGSLEILTDINQETYKYVARVMFENNFFNSAKEYLEKSKNIFYKDPELHFLYAKYYLKTCNYENSLWHLDECLRIIPYYFPAITLRKSISKYV